MGGGRGVCVSMLRCAMGGGVMTADFVEECVLAMYYLDRWNGGD